MAYLDSAGNVDPTAQPTVERWVNYHAQRQALLTVGVHPSLTAPAASMPSGGEKARK